VSACAWAVAGHQHSLYIQVPDVPVYGYVDPVKLRQVVANLDNVCKHTQMLGRVYLVLERVVRRRFLPSRMRAPVYRAVRRLSARISSGARARARPDAWRVD